MANTEIDSLSLNITISGLNDRDIKNLESLSNSIAKLQRSLKNLELKKLQEIKIPENVKGITGVEYQLIPTKEMAEEFDKMFAGVEETFSKLDTSKLDELEGTLGKINTDVAKIKINANDTINDLDEGEPDKKVGKTKEQLSSMEKTLKRIKLIAFIKLIRGAINSIVQGVKQGLGNLAQFDSSFNETLSKITTAKTQIYNSLALIVSPLIQIFEPVITTISESMINIANTISLITAKIQGASKYTKINVDYMKDYAKELQKAKGFSFDTFNALDTQDNMFETATVDEKEIEKNKTLYEIVYGVMEIAEYSKEIIIDFVKALGQFIKDNKDNILDIVQQSAEFTKTFFDTGKVSLFSDFLSVLVNAMAITVANAGLLLEAVEFLVTTLKPLMMILGNKTIVNLIKLILMTLEPLNTILEYVINPIINEIVELIVNILTPILSVISDIIRHIVAYLNPIFKVLNWIIEFFGGAISGLLKAIFTLLNPILSLLNDFSGIIEGLVDMIEGIFTLDFDKFFDGFMKVMMRYLLGIVRFFATIIDSIVNFFMEALNALFGNTAIQKVLQFFGVDYHGITWRLRLADEIPSYANGGVVGEIWQMNEYGNPEMLYNPNNNSNTSVINVEQLSSAFERAIINTGLLNAIEEGRVVYIDGKYVAQSKNFKNELNRTNPNLNIR